MSGITEKLKTAIADRYVIERELGAGGMATVYLAQDVKHDRKVALKVLRPELAAVIGAERFLQEIKVTANLQHSHILPLYDSGAAEGFLYYVMPYVEGETLRTRLVKEKQLGVDDAVALARAIAAALEHAHKQGVIHRDIKPENILLRDGDPLIADFGIALALSHAGGNRLTETGLSIGTPHYMSPEQAMGDRELDARSDVYSLGAMLYEMLVGDPPYQGSTAQAIVAKVITEKAPPVTTIRDTVPPHVSAAIAKALAKLPADRFSTAASFADALSRPGLVDVGMLQAATAVTTPSTGPDAGRLVRRTVMPAALIALAGIAAWGWFRGSPPLAVARFDVAAAGGGGPSTAGNGAALAIAPDGSSFVYAAVDGQLWARSLDQLEARALPARGTTPFFSPDGAWVGFADGTQLKKVAPAGGPPLVITSIDIGNFRGATWGEDGTIVFTPSVAAPLLRVADGGGPADTLTRFDQERGATSHRWPFWLPGQRGLLFQACRGTPDSCEIAVLDLRTGDVRYLLPGLRPQYVPTGHVVYASTSGALLAAPFDVDRMELTGNPVSLMEGVLIRESWNGDFAIAGNGSLIYVTGEAAAASLSVVDTAGRIEVLLPNLSEGFAPRLSPDGRRIALRAAPEGASEIWTFDREQATLSRLTFEGGADYPVWSPRGDTVYYSADPTGQDRDLWRRAADGSGVPEQVLAREGQQWEIAIPSSGDVALIREIPGAASGTDLLRLPLRPTAEPEPWVVTEFTERSPVLSPDGRWAAYTSNESGQDEVYVRAFPEAAGRWQISAGGGQEPHWSADGRTIYYARADTLFAAAVQTRPGFAVGQRRRVFAVPYVANASHTNYDRDPRTGEFIMMVRTQADATALVVVLNWFEEVRQRMGSVR